MKFKFLGSVKIEYLLCACVSNISGVWGKVWSLNASLNTFLSFLYTPLINKSIKNAKKASLWFKDIVTCII